MNVILAEALVQSVLKWSSLVVDWLQSFEQFFINVPYHILVASYSDGSVLSLKQSHQSKTSYKYYDTLMKIVLRTGASLPSLV